MSRPKKMRKLENCNALSPYPHYMDGFNECKKLYDEFIPDEKELEEILLNNCVPNAKEIAYMISERLR